MFKKINSNQAVSEVVGVVLLLGMTITLFAILNSNILPFSINTSVPSVNLIGTIDKANKIISIEHNGGETLEGKTNIIITIGSDTYSQNASDLLIDINNDNDWNFGENLQFSFAGKDITGKFIQVMVVDFNAVLLSVVLQEGLS